VKAGELVVLVKDVQGVAAGKEGRVMSVREDAVIVECRLQEQLHFVLARTWDVLPKTIYRRLLKRQRQ
jgi:hypothetical protein